MRLLAALLLVPVLAAQPSVNQQRRAAYPQLFQLTELARSAPPEFAARALLQILDSNSIPTADWKLDLAAEALSLAKAARHPLPKRLAPGIVAVDNQAMLWSTAYSQNLDALSLSARALARLPKSEFANIPRPSPATPSCRDALLDDPSAWYQAAARAQVAPLPLIQTISSHAEIAPAIDLIFQRQNSPEDLDTLSGALAARLAALPPSARAFNAALFSAPRKIKHLLTVLESHQRPTAPLAEAWRTWMTNGLSAPACTESTVPGPQQQARLDAFELFNSSQSPPLPPELLKPAGTPEPAELQPFADNEDTRHQASLFKQLLFGNQSRALSETEKNTPEWRELMQQYIQSIERRTRSASESDIEFFYRQSQLWSGVLMAAPAGPTRQRALNQFLSFLLASAPHIDPLVWFSQLEAIAELTRSLHGNEFPKLLDSLRLTAHPVLTLYAELESAFPTRPSTKDN